MSERVAAGFRRFAEEARGRSELYVELAERDGPAAVCKGKGESEGQTTVAARFALACYNLRDRDSALYEEDDHLIKELRRRYRLLRPAPQQKDGTPCG